ncbi:hypothetical protein DL93DRAFT_856042 [Clavulina sp. PMI_390]|nr:hypothetical protein DL93DRAFT_856042 [Clavulina sp. PMI_390]
MKANQWRNMQVRSLDEHGAVLFWTETEMAGERKWGRKSTTGSSTSTQPDVTRSISAPSGPENVMVPYTPLTEDDMIHSSPDAASTPAVGITPDHSILAEPESIESPVETSCQGQLVSLASEADAKAKKEKIDMWTRLYRTAPEPAASNSADPTASPCASSEATTAQSSPGKELVATFMFRSLSDSTFHFMDKTQKLKDVFPYKHKKKSISPWAM